MKGRKLNILIRILSQISTSKEQIHYIYFWSSHIISYCPYLDTINRRESTDRGLSKHVYFYM